MSAQNAKDAASEIIERLRLQGVSKGGKLQLVIFDTDQDCRFFYPRRALEWQRQVNTFVSRAVRKSSGLKVQRIVLTPEQYHAWKGEREDSLDLRRRFADQHVHLKNI